MKEIKVLTLVLTFLLFAISISGANPTHPDDVEAIKLVYNSTGGPNWTIQPNLNDPCASTNNIFSCFQDGSYSRIYKMFVFSIY